jgi:secondary thiamine-phosphate synthase enzyme
MKELVIKTSRHTEFVEVTTQVQSVIDGGGVKEGLCICFVPHTTAGITINENADPDVVTDMIYALEQAVPWKDPHYRHGEGNTAAHVKSSMMGHSAHILIRGGKLQFGTWQGIYLCEFDGPRSRRLWISVTAQAAE